MSDSRLPRVENLARAFGIPPKRPVYFIVNSQLCAAALMVGLGLFCLWASSALTHNDIAVVLDVFKKLGIPAESRPELWFLAGEFLTAWAFGCASLALLGGKGAKQKSAKAMRLLIAGQTVSALIAAAFAAAMNNFVRWPLAVIAALWLWTVWGYWGIARSWNRESMEEAG